MSNILDLNEINKSIIDLDNGRLNRIFRSHDMYIKYNFDYSNNIKLLDTSAGPVSYIHPDTVQLVTVPAEQALVLPRRGFTALPAIEQYARKTDDVASWNTGTSGTGLTPVITSNYADSPLGIKADRVILDIGEGTTSADYSQIDCPIAVGKNGIPWVYLLSLEGNVDVSMVHPGGTIEKKSLVENVWQRCKIDELDVSAAGLRVRLRGNEGTAKYADLLVIGAQFTAADYWPIYIANDSDVVGGTVLTTTRAGTTALPLDLDGGARKARDAFDGKADGVGVIGDIDFADGEIWGGLYWTVDNKTTFTTTSNGYGPIRDDSFIPGDRYEIEIYGGPNCVAYMGNNPGNCQELGADGVYRATCQTDQTSLYLRNTTSGQTTVTKCTVKKLSPAAFAMHGEFTPGAGAGDVPNNTSINIITATDSATRYLYLRVSSGGIPIFYFYDGANPAALSSFDWQANTTYEFKVLVGYHIASAARKMQLWVREKGAIVWTESPLSPVVGHLPIGDAEKLTLGYGTAHMISVDKLRIRRVETIPGWRSAA